MLLHELELNINLRLGMLFTRNSSSWHVYSCFFHPFSLCRTSKEYLGFINIAGKTTS